MNLNELMRGYLHEGIQKKDPLENIIPSRLIRESFDLPVDVIKSEWALENDPEQLMRIFHFENVGKRNWFLTEILENEKISHHHGKITIEGTAVKVELQTHDLGRVTELDQEYASYCDEVWDDVDFVEEKEKWEK